MVKTGNLSINNYSIEPTDENIIFKATEAPGGNGVPYLRTSDTEYKILNDLAKQLGDEVDAKGKVPNSLNYTCGNCNYIIRQFKDKYPNIGVEVIHNNNVPVKPN
ncbi:deaminase domain-containing protein [Paenibacillus sp. NPDC058071]|uniref:deaminase domain-containing protein n=1 Tax=Paenibacillus sp. NPDC058071 TaxID=3346326 RepID=UPI0036DF7AE2